MTKKPLLAILLIGVIIGLILPIALPGAGEGDFIAYWAASHLWVTGQNPYDQQSLSILQQSVRPDRFEAQAVVISAWNPPWLMVLFSPLGLMPFDVAVHTWITANIILVGLSVALAWDIVVKPFHERGFLLLLAATLLFVDTVIMIMLGQITSLTLFGSLLAARLIQNKRDISAGATLLVLTIKPHLSFLFLFTIFIWIFRQRHWKILIGFAANLIVSLLVFTFVCPGWFTSYLKLVAHMPYASIDTSTFGSFIQANTGISIFRFVGVLLLPLGFWLVRMLEGAGWLTVMNISAMLTLSFAPYGFGVDQVLMVLVITEMTGWLIIRARKLWQSVAILSTPLIVSIVWLIVTPYNVPNNTLFWIPLAFLLIYTLLWKAIHR
jgi:hypothetical protein